MLICASFSRINVWKKTLFSKGIFWRSFVFCSNNFRWGFELMGVDCRQVLIFVATIISIQQLSHWAEAWHCTVCKKNLTVLQECCVLNALYSSPTHKRKDWPIRLGMACYWKNTVHLALYDSSWNKGLWSDKLFIISIFLLSSNRHWQNFPTNAWRSSNFFKLCNAFILCLTIIIFFKSQT